MYPMLLPSRGAAAAPMCAARTAVSCRRDGTAISKTHLPDRGTTTAPGGVTNYGPAWKADELSAAWCSRFHQPNADLEALARRRILPEASVCELWVQYRWSFRHTQPHPAGLSPPTRAVLGFDSSVSVCWAIINSSSVGTTRRTTRLSGREMSDLPAPCTASQIGCAWSKWSRVNNRSPLRRNGR